jgi:hypothetical protein
MGRAASLPAPSTFSLYPLERGLRAERACIAAAVDWDPRVMFGARPMLRAHAELSMPVAAARAFDVPLIDEGAAESLIQSQRELVVAA